MSDEIVFEQRELPSTEPGGAVRLLVHSQDDPDYAVLLTPVPHGWMVEAGGEMHFADSRSDAIIEAHSWIRCFSRAGARSR